MSDQEILYRVDDPVATITLNRPDRLNALTPLAIEKLRQALSDAAASPEVVGIVLTGAGRGFCSGVDMAALRQIQEAGDIDEVMRPSGAAPAITEPGSEHHFERGLTPLLALPKPIIAAINGPAVGLGFSLAMLCDLRFAAEGAFLSTSFAQRGLVAEHGMSWLLPRLVGPARALDMLWSGRRVPATEALQLGLVNRVTPPEKLLEDASAYVHHLAATASPRALMHMKRQVYRHLMAELGPAMRETEELQQASVTWPDFAEGLASFQERRPPRFERIGTSEPDSPPSPEDLG